MSTILDILKKLEEEKSVLEQGLDLKGMVLRREPPVYSRSNRERPSPVRIFSALVIGGIAVGVGLGVFLIQPETGKSETASAVRRAPAPKAGPPPAVSKPEETVTPAPAQARGGNEPGVTPPTPAREEKKEERLGIPLASIGEEDGKGGPAEEPIPVIALPEVPARNAGAKPAPPSPAQPQLQAQPQAGLDREAAEGSVPDFKDINAIIENSRVEKVEAVVRPKNDPLPYSPIRIPGVKVKGIIYFGKDNPASYILVASLQNISQKMKVGEEISGATLKEVQPSFAVFSYQGEMAQLRIGE
ncbi:MAG: hypothetical protein HY579_07925 [Nitrospinae bacterium]|nr:hypothetical protein [Nitrospinota bacterium]